MASRGDATDRRREQAELIVVVAGESFLHPLPQRGEVVVGREDGVDLALGHASVSRRHLTIVVESESAFVVDLGSSNGTRLSLPSTEAERTARTAEVLLCPHERVALPDGATLRAGQVTLFFRRRPMTDVQTFAASSPALDEARAVADRVAPLAYPVLLLGETGVGKELFARRLHEASPRREGPFVTIPCAALNPGLVESELFGHERGSFTGAEATKVGLFEAARGGTVLLDEVAELPLVVQAKLLRVLEELRIQPLGASETRALDVRFVATAHPDLEGDVERGTFRRDLLFRLNGVTIHVPPLRQRREEIAPLAQHFALSVHGRPKTLSQAALDVLRDHDWPGNVRELRNVIERAVVLSSDHVLGPEHLELGFRTAALAPTSERERIIDALRQAAGNQTRAAEILGISRRTLVTRLRDYDIPRPRGGRSA